MCIGLVKGPRRARVSAWHQAGLHGWELGRSRSSQGSSVGSSAVSGNFSLVQVSCLQWSFSIFADAIALLGRALTSSDSAAEIIHAILALGFTSCQSRQKLLIFRVQMSPFYLPFFGPVLVVYIHLCFA